MHDSPGTFYLDSVLALSDAECLAYTLFTPLLPFPDQIYPALFDYTGLFCADKYIEQYVRSEFPEVLSLLSLYCHCILHRQATDPVDLIMKMSELDLKKFIFYLYPGIYSVKMLERNGLNSAQIHCSWSNLDPENAYIVHQGQTVFLCNVEEGELSSEVRSVLQQLVPGQVHFHRREMEERGMKDVMVEDAVFARPSYPHFMRDHLTTLGHTVFN